MAEQTKKSTNNG